MEKLQRTLLYDEHVARGARMVPFAGWEMPVQYVGLRQEHDATRSAVGIFDVSHMGEIWFRGPEALKSLQWMTTNDIGKLVAGQAQYGLISNPDGGIVDDIIVYCVVPQQEYMVCVNAANIEKDYRWFLDHNRGAQIENESSHWSQIAIQGPRGLELAQRVLKDWASLQDLGSFRFLMGDYQGARALVARTGYTGEPGVEVFIENSGVVALWRDLLGQGQDLGVSPVGLGARDTLRTEMKYPLYGHEITDQTTPYEAGLGWAVKPKAKDFLGREPMIRSQERPLRKLVGFRLEDKGIPRDGYDVLSPAGEKIGWVTSGTFSPTLNGPIGIAYVPPELSGVGSKIHIDIRGRAVAAVVVDTPFVKK